MYRIKTDKRSIQSCQLIYEALSKLMKSQSFESITIQQLALTAKVGRATFYRYFEAIEDVLWMKCDETFNQLKDHMISYYQMQNHTQEDRHFPFFKPFLRFWYTHSDIIEQLTAANRMDIFTTSFTKMFVTYSTHLPKSKNTSVIYEHMDYFLAIRTGVAVNILTQWIQNGKNIPPDQLADLVIAQFKATADIQALL